MANFALYSAATAGKLRDLDPRLLTPENFTAPNPSGNTPCTPRRSRAASATCRPAS